MGLDMCYNWLFNCVTIE